MQLAVLGVEVTLPVVLLGSISGMTYGLLAVGLVLIYRASRVINFAQGQIGAAAAVILSVMVIEWSIPYWVAFPGALALGASIGAVSEMGIMRRLRKAPSIMSVVALLGLGQLLLYAALTIGGLASSAQGYPAPPWLPEFDVGALRITPEYSGMLLLTPLLVAGLAWFLRATRYGLALRAAAANTDKARLSGVYAARMTTMCWAIAGAVSAFAAVLLLPAHGTGSVLMFGPALLIRALAAGVVARMQNLPIALLSGVLIGVIEQLLLWNYRSPSLVELVLFIGILVTLLVQRRESGRLANRSRWTVVQPWEPIPRELLRIAPIRYLGHISAALVLLGAILVPAFLSHRTAVVLTAIVAFGIVGLSVGVVTGLGGQLSLGQFALAGVGAAVSFVVVRATGSLPAGLVVGALAATAVSFIVGLPALRIPGLMLAVSTLSFAAAAQLWLFQQSWMYGDGLRTEDSTIFGLQLNTGRSYYFYFALPVAVVAFWLTRNVWRSGVGRQLRAVRDNEDAARGFTVSAVRVKLLGFAIAGFLAGLGGTVFAQGLTSVQATAFPVPDSINVVAMAVLGGIGTIAGPLIGAFYIIGVPRFLPLDNAGLAASSLGWLLLVLYFPGGIAQLIRPLRASIINRLARRYGVERVNDDVADEVAPGPLDAAPPKFGPTPRAPRVAPEVLLDATALSKKFGGVQAVDRVDLCVANGEILGLIGPNGAGKTTLFELISGFTRPDSGAITFNGADVTKLSPQARARAGLIRSFQDAFLFPTLTVSDTVKLALERSDPTRFVPSILGSTRGERRKDARAMELLGALGLAAYADKQIRELSTGTRRITELACMVALEPVLLLLDEPSSGIAQRETERLGELLLELKQSLNLTMVIVEHDIPLIMRLADRMVVMESGRVLAEGTPADIRQDPKVIDAYLGGNTTAIERSDAAMSAPHAHAGGVESPTPTGSVVNAPN